MLFNGISRYYETHFELLLLCCFLTWVFRLCYLLRFFQLGASLLLISKKTVFCNCPLSLWTLDFSYIWPWAPKSSFEAFNLYAWGVLTRKIALVVRKNCPVASNFQPNLEKNVLWSEMGNSGSGRSRNSKCAKDDLRCLEIFGRSLNSAIIKTS